MTVCKLKKLDLTGLIRIASILYTCGQDMAKRYDLHHWDNSHIKNMVIVCYCAMKNSLYLVYSENTPVATFQVKKTGDRLTFEKLATLPRYEGRGVGSFCINTIETIGRDLDCTEIRCGVYSKSKHAIEFYEHKGYCKYDTVKTRKYDELLMKKVY